MTLKGVRKFLVAECTLHETMKAIRSAGRDGYELFVLWSGTLNGDTFTVAEVHIPQQTSYKLRGGLCVRVEGSELHRVNVWLYETRQVIGVQVHSHPGNAYHSETDDTYPIATIEGSLSIVLPHFGRDGWESSGIAAYRLGKDGWTETSGPLSDLIGVLENGVS